jgi:hypothetical protein
MAVFIPLDVDDKYRAIRNVLSELHWNVFITMMCTLANTLMLLCLMLVN